MCGNAVTQAGGVRHATSTASLLCMQRYLFGYVDFERMIIQRSLEDLTCSVRLITAKLFVGLLHGLLQYVAPVYLLYH